MKLHYLLDTNICIYIAKQKPTSVFNKFRQLSVGEVGMSVITYGELIYGAQKSLQPKQTLAILKELQELILPLPMPMQAAKYYGEIRSQLEKEGKLIGNSDLWIAAHALAQEVVLITNNIKEFNRIKHLKVENWVN